MWDWLISALEKVVNSIWLIGQDVFCWALDGLLSVAQSALATIPLPDSAFQFGAQLGNLPSEMLDMFAKLGLGYCLALVVGALAVRLVLQLIPFVRLGS